MSEPDVAPASADELLSTLLGRWPMPDAEPVAWQPGAVGGAAAVTVDLPATGCGALDGLRLAVKDNVTVAGVPTAIGSGLPGFTADRDAEVVARARAAGARVVAKAQCEAFLLGANSFTSRPAPVRNPHDPARSAGGSSSGSAVLVATGECELAVGTDSGGSVRIPASHCGVVGFKPTRGRVPFTGIAPLEPFLEHAGPMASTVDGATALFTVLDGDDGLDPRQAWSITGPLPPTPPGGAGELRMGVLHEQLELADPDVRAVLDAALSRLESAGAQLRPITWPAFEEADQLHLAIYLTGQAMTAARGGPVAVAAAMPIAWPEWRDRVEGELPLAVRDAIAVGHALLSHDPGLHVRAVRRALELAAALDALMDGVDALLLPVSPSLPALVPAGAPTDDELYGDTRCTAPFNVTGHPALSLPAGTAGALPVGVQLVGRRGLDVRLLRCGRLVERVLAS